jgi:hypothetical protein
LQEKLRWSFRAFLYGFFFYLSRRTSDQQISLAQQTFPLVSDKRYCRGLPHYTLVQLPHFNLPPLFIANDHHGYDLMVVGFTTIYAISVYHNWCCEFKSRSGQGVQHYVIKLSVTCDMSVVFLCTPVSSTNKPDCHDLTEILLKVALSTINPNQTIKWRKWNCPL